MLGSGILNWNFNSSLAISLEMNNISWGFVNINLVIFEHFVNTLVSLYSDTWILLFDFIHLSLENTDGSSELILKSFIFLFNFSSSHSNFNTFSPFWSFKIGDKSFQSSFDLIIGNSFRIINFFQLSKEGNELSFVLLILRKILIGRCSACGTLSGQTICSNFKASDVW